MKYIYSFLIFLLCSASVAGQKNLSVTGILLDKSTEEPVEAATIRVLNAKDSSFVAGGLSNRSGIFTLKELSKGNFILHITYLGYRDLYKPVSLTGSPTTVRLGNLYFETDAILLEEAVIVGKAAEMVVRNDTIEYNAGSYKLQENSAVEELLKKLPGVEVETDGKITVNGKEVKKFLVDGKEFFSDDPTVASKNLPADMVEKLQVLDRKSDMARMTGFDDGEEETVINITVKPGMKQGFMGNAMAGGGSDLQSFMDEPKDFRYQAGGMFNYMRNNDRYTLMVNANNNNNLGAADMGARRFGGMRGMRRGSGGIVESQSFIFNMNKEFSPKLSLNGDISYTGSDRNSINDATSVTLSGKNSQMDKTRSNTSDISDNFWTSYRLEWKPDDNNTFIFRPNFGYNSSTSEQSQEFGRFDDNTLDTLFAGNSSSFNKGKGYNLGASLEYAHTFKKLGRIFSARLEGTYNDSYSQGYSDWRQQIYEGGVYDRDSIRNQRSENDNTSKNYSFYTSYVEPLGKNYFMQLAYRVRLFDTESINSTYLEQENSEEDLLLNLRESRSTLRSSTEQRITLNFKSVREKYNYTVGINIDPTSSVNKTYQPTDELIEYDLSGKRLPNVIGDSLISKIDQNVVNLSPVINFNYLFGQRSNLRIDYSGNTNQPSARQLQDYVDQSDPMNLVQGNPNLKPGYSNRLDIRFNKSIPESQLFYNIDLNGNLSLNDITAVTRINEDRTRLTTYENINGNWDVSLRGGFNMPLRNKKFTVGSFANMSFSNAKSYVYLNNNQDSELNTTQNLSLQWRPRANFRTEKVEVGLTGFVRYRNITNEIQPDRDQETTDWGGGGNIVWYLPLDFTFDTDISWSKRSGYMAGFNISETLWNASLAKKLFSKKAGTGTLKFTVYDILQDRNNINMSTTTNGYRYSASNTIPSFFMCSFIYKFSVFPGNKASENDMQFDRRGPGGRRGPRPF